MPRIGELVQVKYDVDAKGWNGWQLRIRDIEPSSPPQYVLGWWWLTTVSLSEDKFDVIPRPRYRPVRTIKPSKEYI